MTTASWATFAREAPELAARAQAAFEATKHHLLATLAKDGSPRIHAVEVQFHGDDLTVGMMFQSIKALQLIRDGRFALHANPGEDMGAGDAKITGLAEEVTDTDALDAYIAQVQPPPPFHMFRMMLSDVVVTSLNEAGDRLVVERWQPGRGVDRIER